MYKVMGKLCLCPFYSTFAISADLIAGSLEFLAFCLSRRVLVYIMLSNIILRVLCVLTWLVFVIYLVLYIFYFKSNVYPEGQFLKEFTARVPANTMLGGKLFQLIVYNC